jgi:tetratricopeptide (TPR) repeat protein
MELWRESLALLEQIGDVKGKAATLHNMAGLVAQQGDVNRAMELWEESLAIERQIGNLGGQASTLSMMAGVVAQQGDVNRAMELWRESLALLEQIGDVQGKAATLANLAQVLVGQDENRYGTVALRMIGESQASLFQIQAFPDLMKASEIGIAIAMHLKVHAEARRAGAYRIRAALRLNENAKAAEGVWVFAGESLQLAPPLPPALPELAILGYKLCEEKLNEHFEKLVNAAAGALELTQEEFAARAKALDERLEKGELAAWLEPILDEFCNTPLPEAEEGEAEEKPAE